jgi:TP901 family phage tail tape measure protein
MPTAARLEVVVGADIDPLKRGLAEANRSVTGFGGVLAGVGGVVATGMAAAGAAIAGGVAVGIKAAGDLEQQIANISTIKPEINFSQVFGALNEMQTRVPQSAAALGQGLYDIFSSVEVSADEGIQLLEKFAKGATGAGTDASTWGTAVMGVMNAYGATVADVDGIQDVFFNTINRGVVSGQELANGLGPVTQSAKAAGLSIQELGAYLAAVTKEGGPASENINNLNNFLQKITTKEAQTQLEALGVATKTATGEFRPTAEVLTDLKERLGGMTEAARANALQAIFPDSQARTGAMVLMSQLELVKTATEENQRATGSAAAAYEKMSQTFNSQSKLAVNGLVSIATTIGGELLPHITPLITTFSKELPGAFQQMRTAAAPIGSLMEDIADAGRTVGQVFGEGWEPSAEIEPLALAAGNGATALKGLAEAAGRVGEAADRLGSWDTFTRALEASGREADRLQSAFNRIGESLNRFDSIAGRAGSSADTYARALGAIGTAAQLSIIPVATVIDTFSMMAAAGLDLANGLFAVARGLYALANGDIPTFLKAGDLAIESFRAAGRAALEWSDNNARRAQEAYRAIAGSAQAEMPTMASAVESNMAAATAAVSTGSQGMAQFMEANGAAMVASTQTSMTGVVGAIDAAGPQMAAAAESGAGGAVAAVQGQAGPASAAGQAVGDGIGSGMQSGIMSWIGNVVSAARSMVSQAIGAARAEADAHSPSRKMQQLGKDLVAGIEGELAKADLSREIVGQLRDLMSAAREYVPTAREIARVEREIGDIRERAQSDALWRADEIVDVESELLRLKRDQAVAERDLLPLRREVAAAEREVRDLTEGSLSDRAELLALDTQRKQLRLQTLDLEKQLVGLDRDSKRAKGIEEQIDKLRDQDRLLGLEAERIRTTNDVAAAGARARALGLSEILTVQERNIEAVGREVTALSAEEAVFRANEAIIKNATDNEIRYRQKLIEVFNAEGKPLRDRITAGLALVDQLEAEEKISKELADELRKVARESGVSAEATRGLGSAAAAADPQIAAAAKKAEEMARQANRIAAEAGDAAGEVSELAKALGRLPSWFTPKGGGKDSLGFGGRSDGGGGLVPVMSAPPASLLGGMSGGSSSPVETHRFVIQEPSGRTLEEWYVTGRELALRRGRGTDDAR